MKELLEELAKALVDDPESVEVTRTDLESTVVLELRVAEADRGKVIGKQGRIVKALRSIVKAVGMKEGKKVTVEIID